MSTFPVLRRIALLIQLLKEELRPTNRPELSDEKVGDLLNAALGSPSSFLFDKSKVNQLLNMRMRLDAAEETSVLNALQRVIADKTSYKIDVTLEPPRWVERNYAKGLPEHLREPYVSPTVQGEQLADKARFLEGLWEFFAVATEPGSSMPCVFRFAIIFQPASAMHMDLLMISRSREWRGTAYMNGNHLYLNVRDVGDTKAALFITNLPLKHRPRLSGIVATIAPEASGIASVPPTVGALCFAEKRYPLAGEDRGLADAVKQLIDDNVANAELAVQAVRAKICRVFHDLSEFEHTYPRLTEYMKGHRINGETGFPLHTLQLAYS